MIPGVEPQRNLWWPAFRKPGCHPRIKFQGNSLGHAFPDHAQAAASTTANCETYQLAYHRKIHGIGMIKTVQRLKTAVRHSTCHPLALNTISRLVPAMLRDIHRIQAVVTHAQPTMVMKERSNRTYQPM